MKYQQHSKMEATAVDRFIAANRCELRVLPKRYELQRPGTVTKCAYYVKRGLLRSFTIDENGKEHVYTFAPEGWVLSDVESHTHATPSEFFIDALEDSEVYELPFPFDSRIAEQEGNADLINTLFRRIAVLQKRVLLLLSAPAATRYQHFLETYPELVHRVPMKMIASYLGVTPEALSNIRRKLREQEQSET